MGEKCSSTSISYVVVVVYYYYSYYISFYCIATLKIEWRATSSSAAGPGSVDLALGCSRARGAAQR